MILYLIQHGIAVPEEQDPQKPLSMEGIEDTKKMARFLKEKDLKVEQIWHSKKMRSVQTAQIISEAITCKNMEERDDIDPKNPVDKFREEIQGLNADLMIVGHLPFLQKLAWFVPPYLL